MSVSKLVQEKVNSSTPFFSLEFFPPKDAEAFPGFFATVEKLKALNPLFASVTYGAGGSTQERTFEVVSRMVSLGIDPLTHLTCVGATAESVRQYLARLDKAGVTSVLALRGDPPGNDPNYDWSKGEFIHASDLAAFIKKEFPHFGVGIAAYPCPHPESPTYRADREATANKLALSDFGVTQLFFDHREYVEFVEAMRARGCDQPIIPGVLPIQTFESLRRILALSGGNIPGKTYLALEEANAKGGPEAVKQAGLDLAEDLVRRLLDGGSPGIHLYTLNKADMCLQLHERLAALFPAR